LAISLFDSLQPRQIQWSAARVHGEVGDAWITIDPRGKSQIRDAVVHGRSDGSFRLNGSPPDAWRSAIVVRSKDRERYDR
jgi:hypothetical protein